MKTFTLNDAPLSYGEFTDGDGVKHPSTVLDLWSDEELASIGVARVEAADPPPPAPTRVPKLYGKLALKGAGKLAEVESHMLALPLDDDVRLYWDLATHFERHSPLIAGLASQFALSGAAVDDLFRVADALRLADGAAN